MSKCYVVKNEEITPVYNENGFYMEELLPGTYTGGVRNYKCFLKAGCEVSPELKHDESVLIMFGKGKGHIRSVGSVYNITELSFYVPDFDREAYTIHGYEDMEFVISVIEMNEWDRKIYEECHIHLPYFTKYSDAIIYDQDCKGSSISSWWVLSPKQLGRIMVGVVRGIGDGTVEKGHSKVAQWNYCIGNADFDMTVEDEPVVHHKEGDWSYVVAGYDHSLVAQPEKEVFYVWYEHYIREKDFCVSLAPGQSEEDF